MKNKDFQEILKQYPDDMDIRFYDQLEGYRDLERVSVNTFYFKTWNDKFIVINDCEEKHFEKEKKFTPTGR